MNDEYDATEETQRRCDWCEAVIEDGSLGVVIEQHVERFTRPPDHPDGLVDVLDATLALNLCAGCGMQVDFDRLRTVLMEGRGILCPSADDRLRRAPGLLARHHARAGPLH